MKKSYKSPQIMVVEIEIEGAILSSSSGGSDSGSGSGSSLTSDPTTTLEKISQKTSSFGNF